MFGSHNYRILLPRVRWRVWSRLFFHQNVALFSSSGTACVQTAGTGISAEPLSPELIGAIRVSISPETARAYSRPMPTRLDGRELSDRLFAEYLEELLAVGQPLRPIAPTARYNSGDSIIFDCPFITDCFTILSLIHGRRMVLSC